MSIERNNKAQDLCTELFIEVESAMSEAWISDDAYTDDPEEFLEFIRNSLSSLDEARAIIKRFLKRHSKKLAAVSRS